MMFLALDAVLAFIPAWIARGKGWSSYFGWWLYGFFLLIALVHSLVMEDYGERTAERDAP